MAQLVVLRSSVFVTSLAAVIKIAWQYNRKLYAVKRKSVKCVHSVDFSSRRPSQSPVLYAVNDEAVAAAAEYVLLPVTTGTTIATIVCDCDNCY